MKKLDAAPDWYAQAESSPGPGASPESSESPNESLTPAPSYKSPDGAFELVLREDPNDEADQVNMPGHGAHYVLRDLKSGTDTPFADLNGFEGAFGILHEKQNPERHFLFDGTLRLAFFDLHLNSSDGTKVFALDLGRKPQTHSLRSRKHSRDLLRILDVPSRQESGRNRASPHIGE